MPEFTDEELALALQIFDLAREGDAEALAAYVDAGVPVDLTNSKRDTLLTLAAYQGQEAAVSALLARGADTTRLNDRGQGALAAAVFKRSVPVVTALLAAGADPGAGVPVRPRDGPVLRPARRARAAHGEGTELRLTR